MYLNIQGKHLKVTPAINDYVKKKIKRIKKHFDKVLFAHVTLETIKTSHFAEATLSSEHHHFHNRVKSGDMYSSIDILFDKLEVQVRRYKEHLIDKKKHGKNLSSNLNSHIKEITEASQKKNITIDDLEIPKKPMNFLEAALQLRVDNKKHVMGFYVPTPNDNMKEKPNFIEKLDEKQFIIYAFDHFWEKKEAELVFPDKLEIHTISAIKPGYDFIENSIDYLINNESQSHFFTSIRLECVVLLHQLTDNRFETIRESQ